MGLRKINTIGIQQASKVMMLSAIAYNLKKYLKFYKNLSKSIAKIKTPIYKSLYVELETYYISFKEL
ncbi:transposase [Aquimarina rhabdastrellae]